jgi:hypothetical protein
LSDITLPVTNQKISFHFQPYNYDKKEHFIEKSEGDKKKRYLTGTASGMRIDLHGERLTEKAINSLMQQANSGTVLLYPDIHGIKASEDIGILTLAKILPNGDWYVEFRLYDKDDNVPQSKLDVIEILWNQINGNPPYKKPLQKGFSIEGTIPNGGILEMSEDGKRVIDNIALDGVILVPRPAYEDGIANAVYKALGELPSWQADKFKLKVRKSLQEKIQENKTEQNYYTSKYELSDALENEIESIMCNLRLTDRQKYSELEISFDEYKQMMIPIIIRASNIFQSGEGDIEKGEVNNQDKRQQMLSALEKNYQVLKNLIQKRRQK